MGAAHPVALTPEEPLRTVFSPAVQEGGDEYAEAMGMFENPREWVRRTSAKKSRGELGAIQPVGMHHAHSNLSRPW